MGRKEPVLNSCRKNRLTTLTLFGEGDDLDPRSLLKSANQTGICCVMFGFKNGILEAR